MAQTTATSYEDRMVLDRNNQKIGKIDSLHRDQNQGGSQLEWSLVNTGMFGTKRSFVLLRGATMQEDDIRVAFDKDTVKDAPRVETGDELSPDEERRLFDHYGVVYGSDHDRGQSGDRNGPGNSEAMTRSEEEMHVGTETRERGRARLRKYVVTEHEQVTVPVQHEEVRIEREPIDSTNSGEALSGPAISEDEHEMTLHEERVVADTERFPRNGCVWTSTPKPSRRRYPRTSARNASTPTAARTGPTTAELGYARATPRTRLRNADVPEPAARRAAWEVRMPRLAVPGWRNQSVHTGFQDRTSLVS